MRYGPIRLVTNLDNVTVHTDNGLRIPIDCWTLTIEPETNYGFSDNPSDKAELENKTRLTAYGTDWDWPCFRVVVAAKFDSYELVSASSNAIIMSEAHPEGRPMATGFIMTFPDGSHFDLIARDYQQPIDFEDFPSSEAARYMVQQKAKQYAVGANMPFLDWRRVPRPVLLGSSV